MRTHSLTLSTYVSSLGVLWQLLDLLHHGGPGVCCGYRHREDAVFGKMSAIGHLLQTASRP